MFRLCRTPWTLLAVLGDRGGLPLVGLRGAALGGRLPTRLHVGVVDRGLPGRGRATSNTDWSHWVASGKIPSGDSPDVGGPDALDHIDDDIAALVSSGQNTYRFSIEWGRVYPTQADFDSDTPDPQGLAAYDTLLQKLAAAHITPVVTLVHFSLPAWLSDGTPATTANPQGWERPATIDAFTTWCTRAATRWGRAGRLVGHHQRAAALRARRLRPGELSARRPPERDPRHRRRHRPRLAPTRAATTPSMRPIRSTRTATGRRRRSRSPSTSGRSTRYDPTDPDDTAAAQRVDYIWNQWFLNAIVKGNWDDDFDAAYTSPGDVQGRSHARRARRLHRRQLLLRHPHQRLARGREDPRPHRRHRARARHGRRSSHHRLRVGHLPRGARHRPRRDGAVWPAHDGDRERPGRRARTPTARASSSSTSTSSDGP